MESYKEGGMGDRHSLCVSPISPNGSSSAIPEESERRAISPQHVDLHTFRDAIDVNYQRMAITGEELSGVPLEDLKAAADSIIEALNLRKKYMEKIGNYFPSTTKNFLNGHYPKNLPKYRRKNTETCKFIFNYSA